MDAPTAPDPGTGAPVIHRSARSGLADSVLGTRNLMVVAALAVVSLIIIIPLNYLTPAGASSPRVVMIACSVMGLWVIPYLLPAAVVRRPGAALVASIIIGVISIFTTPAGPAALVGNVIGGLFIEVPLALMLYRRWNWWAMLLAAGVFGLLNSLMYVGLLDAVTGIGVPAGIVATGVCSAVVGGLITLVLARLLTKAGVGVDRR